MIKKAIEKLADKEDLSEAEMMDAMGEIMEGRATPAQIGAFLIALRIKGETIDEITGAARVMRDKSIRVPWGNSSIIRGEKEISQDMDILVDTCGTGGDGAGTFNVSTTAAFVIAGAGLRVAKHGNRAVSSLCGSADLIEALGIPLHLTPEQVGLCIDRVGIGFLYAPLLHGAMKHAAGPRKEIGLRTIFNLLGPLTNPAGANFQLLGVYHEDLTEKIARVLVRLGSRGAIVVHGEGGYDEITVTGPTKLVIVRNGEISKMQIAPEDFGFQRAKHESIKGGGASKNAEITISVLKGEKGPRRDMVVLNSGAAIFMAGKAENIKEGVAMAMESIDSGRAMEKLNELITMTREFSRR